MASVYTDQSAALAVEKELYDGQTVRDFTYVNNPGWGVVAKNPNVEGKDYPLPFIVSPGQGKGPVFATAQLQQTAPVANSWALVPGNYPYYHVETLQRVTLLAMQSSRGAFIRGIKLATDTGLKQITNDLCTNLFGSGTGTVGQVSTIATGVIQLTNPGSSVFFEQNMVVQANPTDGGNSPRAALAYVIAVNRALDQVTVATSLGGSAATPASWAANDFLIPYPCLNAVSPGFLGWLPATAPTAGQLWYGVDRSKDSRMFGVYGNFGGASISEALIRHTTLIDREGGVPDYVFINTASWAALATELLSKAVYNVVKGFESEVTFKGIEMMGARGPMTMLADRSCPAYTAFVVEGATVEFASITAAPHIQGLLEGQEETLFFVPNQDAREIRFSAYGQLGIGLPGHSGQLTLPQ